MAKAKISKKITLELSEQEANYIKDMLQNYLFVEDGPEPEPESKMRKDIYVAIQETLHNM